MASSCSFLRKTAVVRCPLAFLYPALETFHKSGPLLSKSSNGIINVLQKSYVESSCWSPAVSTTADCMNITTGGYWTNRKESS
uniref:Secreted protein n=1 Tax=Pyxicephalus adspersus TaxID=30357 RepID=A0AAV3AV23_PYXAD|nr:TPA: hypothetical protein GDO54_010220 [Pyxicephalus adspersus]